MVISDIMSRGVDPVSPDATVQDAAIRMAEDDVGAVLVGDATAVVGILTDRDVLLRLVAAGRDPARVQVREIMSGGLWTCAPEDTVDGVFAQMREHQVRRLPVIGEDGGVVGIVTLADLARRRRDPDEAVRLMRDLAEPHRSDARDGDAQGA